jgi:two-component system sensor histidine kinase MtrB
METIGQSTLAPSQRLVETLARTLRHEVGDLLQTVYATVAILQERLGPALALEKRLLSDLRVRAETCRNELDAVHDLICPLTLNRDTFDLAEVVGGLVNAFARRFSGLRLGLETSGRAVVQGDARRLAQVGNLLLLSACQAAQKQVQVQVAGGSEVQWSIHDDGPGASAEQLSWLTAPFSTTHHAQFGLGLALAGRVAGLHGGRVEAGNEAGGFRVRLFLPRARPDGTQARSASDGT